MNPHPARRRMNLLPFFLALLLGVPLTRVLSADPVLPVISNLKAVQRPGTFYVDVTYDLIDPDSPGGVYILAEASADDGVTYPISMRSMGGDAGLVTPGVGKKLIWFAWNDWGGNYTTNARVRLIADDFPSTIGTANAGNYTTNVPPSTNLVWIPSGAFDMQGTHVWLTKSIWMGKYEVTQGEYLDVMGSNPSGFTGNPYRPVENVSWADARDYCNRLTARERSAGRIGNDWEYRLPTEAEWEYACRAGTMSKYSFGEDPLGNRLGFYAWYNVNSGGQTQPVGGRAPNRWGLYDMHGNVKEWCLDSYRGLPGGNVTDPLYVDGSGAHTMRGGGYADGPNECAAAQRDYAHPWYTSGLRIVVASIP